MLLVLFQLDLIVDVIDFSIDPDTDIALMADMFEHLLVLPLLAPDDLGHDEHLRPFRQFLDLVDHLIHGLLRDRFAAFRTMRTPGPGIDQAQVVIYLRDSTDRRTRIMARRLLIDRDSRGKSLDVVDIRLVHLPQELTGIGRQGFHVATLPLGIDGIECQ